MAIIGVRWDKSFYGDKGKDTYCFQVVDKDGDENFPNNYKKGRKDISSVPCNLCGLHEDGQKESLVCPIVKMKYDDEENYDQLFGDNIPKSLVKKIRNISKF